MGIRASATLNSVTRNQERIAPYFRKIGGEKYSYGGYETKRSELEKLGKSRKQLGFKYKIFKVKGGYIIYTSTSRYT